jgi:hypothetical protein
LSFVTITTTAMRIANATAARTTGITIAALEELGRELRRFESLIMRLQIVYEPMMIVEELSEDAALTRLSQYWPFRPTVHTHALFVH